MRELQYYWVIKLYLDDRHQGKRSISDHMHEGTKYIKHLENKVKELQAKRDKLKKLSDLSPVVSDSESFSTTHLPICVIVHPFPGGVQIKCSYSFRKYVFPLSRVIHMVLKEGLDVLNCTSTKTDDSFIHTIRLEVPYRLIIFKLSMSMHGVLWCLQLKFWFFLSFHNLSWRFHIRWLGLITLNCKGSLSQRYHLHVQILYYVHKIFIFFFVWFCPNIYMRKTIFSYTVESFYNNIHLN